MKLAHNLKVEDDDKALSPLAQTLGCPLCQYTTTNMERFKNHMITSHNKDAWNWSLEVTGGQQLTWPWVLGMVEYLQLPGVTVTLDSLSGKHLPLA